MDVSLPADVLKETFMVKMEFTQDEINELYHEFMGHPAEKTGSGLLLSYLIETKNEKKTGSGLLLSYLTVKPVGFYRLWRFWYRCV
jgi:hypothetical protein